MKTSVAVLAALTAVALVVPAAPKPAAQSSTKATPPASAFLPRNGGMIGPQQNVFFGYVESLTRRGRSYVARVDPSLMLTGITASTAGVEDGKLRPGQPPDNDYYERNETKRLLTYRVPANAHVTVITNPGTGPRSTVVPVSELAQIVKGKNPTNRPGLWVPPVSGFQIRVKGDRALALDQAYRP